MNSILVQNTHISCILDQKCKIHHLAQSKIQCSGFLMQSKRFFKVKNTWFKIHSVSLILYFCSCFSIKDAVEPRWLFSQLQWLYPLIAQLKEVVFHELLFLFMPSPSRYGCKRKGHPCMERGINMTFNNLNDCENL